MTTYENLPHPSFERVKFNKYLRDNNEVLTSCKSWIVIKNSYIENQVVIFSTQDKKYITELSPLELVEMTKMLLPYRGKEVYINSDANKSVPNRLHIHIKL